MARIICIKYNVVIKHAHKNITLWYKSPYTSMVKGSDVATNADIRTLLLANSPQTCYILLTPEGNYVSQKIPILVIQKQSGDGNTAGVNATATTGADTGGGSAASIAQKEGEHG